MFFKRTILAGALALAAVGVTGAALAASAVATTPVNVRSGPGTSYSVIDTLRRGERVEVAGCLSGWCFVSSRYTDGFVSARYLERRAGSPSINFSINFGTFPGPRPPRPGIRPPRPGSPSFGWPVPGPGWPGPWIPR